MNLLHFFGGRVARVARERAGVLEQLVELAKCEERASENRLRETIAKSREIVDSGRSPVAGALIWKGRRDV